ncbi:hypothetical protein GOP47_0020840 [Adiantum capillus-veneris]|uniref:Uncharacterized protein n=1 Tax=Adiantum capillus-veneris TaxID=13818 RepID=A0A9D4UAG4_ADICA|nr:hypothetical protein GOP47_0020840 [Adiantum capillus-veneris]
MRQGHRHIKSRSLENVASKIFPWRNPQPLSLSSNFTMQRYEHSRSGAMASPLIAGLTVAAAAIAGRYSIRAWQAFKTRPRIRRFYEGGFQPTMTRREAALILGVRESVAQAKVKEAHRKRKCISVLGHDCISVHGGATANSYLLVNDYWDFDEEIDQPTEEKWQLQSEVNIEGNLDDS